MSTNHVHLNNDDAQTIFFFMKADSLWMTGFGISSQPPNVDFGLQPFTLQHAEFDIIDDIETCFTAMRNEFDDDDDYLSFDEFSDSAICTNSSSAYPCYGDGGNPVYDEENGVLAGIFLGPTMNCGVTKLPSINMKVASFVSAMIYIISSMDISISDVLLKITNHERFVFLLHDRHYRRSYHG